MLCRPSRLLRGVLEAKLEKHLFDRLMAVKSELNRAAFTRSMDTGRSRYFSDGKGRVLSEEERGAENVYIQKMERERREKQRQKEDKEKAEERKDDSGKKPEGGH